MAIHESGEDYLEAILLLSKQQKDVHSVEVARKLGVAKPTVTKAVKNLVQMEYITMDGMHLKLTEKGMARAEEIYEKHTLITRFWELLGVPTEPAERDACRMEHLVSPEVYEAISNFVEKNGK